MKRQLVVRLVKWAVSAAAVSTLLMLSPATQERIVTTAHAAAQRVLVVNGENRPVPVTPGNDFFQARVFIVMAQSDHVASNTFVIPAGMRLVLENITGLGASSSIRLVEVTQGSTGKAVLLPSAAVAGTWPWAGTVTTKVLFDAGSVTVIISRPTAPGGSGAAANYVTLTGYLVPI
jgi:hypothetical protein